MNKTKKESFFWTSYSDLMTSMFFVMLILFVLMVVLFQNKIKEIEHIYKTTAEYLDTINKLKQELEKEKATVQATQQELKKIKEIEESVKNINSDYFEYDPQYKRHTLKNIEISFRKESSYINDIGKDHREKLVQVGVSIKNFVQKAVKKNPNVKYLLIVEGQSSSDTYIRNSELSYERALSLVKYWKENGINFEKDKNCEIIISGSGDKSQFRDKNNEKNQRFVIHIIPKPGIIESSINQDK
jgi:flagellar motor protein MotB